MLARLYRTALEHLGVRRLAEGDRPAGHPDLGARRPRATHSTTPGRGSRRCRGRSARPCPSWSAGSGTRRARRAGPPRLHPERHQQDARRALQPAAGAGRAGVGADQLGRARRPGPPAGPLDHPDRARPPRGAAGTRSAPPSAWHNACRRSNSGRHWSPAAAFERAQPRVSSGSVVGVRAGQSLSRAVEAGGDLLMLRVGPFGSGGGPRSRPAVPARALPPWHFTSASASAHGRLGLVVYARRPPL